MDNNTIRIEQYLRNEMTAAERAQFEAELLVDSALKMELDIQRQITDAAYNAGLKASFAKAIQIKAARGRVLRWSLLSVAAMLAILLFIFKDNIIRSGARDVNDMLSDKLPAVERFVKPPLSGINVPYEQFELLAEKGDTLFSTSGSIILIPPSSLLDEAGNIIKGKVQIRYREFSRPIDFFVSGIPMSYDSAGKRYDFESSAMCDITATQFDKAVFVNPDANPEIFLTSNNADTKHNLYFLDTAKRAWEFRGKDVVSDLKNIPTVSKGITIINESTNILPKPIKPVKASADRQSFTVAIDPESFEELKAYNNLRFEVMNESSYKSSDAEEHWDNMVLDRADSEGLYFITFSNTKRKVSYLVRPALEGADYAKALQVFNEQKRAYDAALQNRLTGERDSIDAVNKKLLQEADVAKRESDRLRQLIIARNNEMRRKQNDRLINYQVMRGFTIRQFGIWNCDQPLLFTAQPLISTFTDEENRSLLFESVTVLYKNFNGLFRYANPDEIKILPGREHMIWAVKDSSLFYFTYEDFNNSGLKSYQQKSYTFKLRRYKHMITSYEEIAQFVERL